MSLGKGSPLSQSGACKIEESRAANTHYLSGGWGGGRGLHSAWLDSPRGAKQEPVTEILTSVPYRDVQTRVRAGLSYSKFQRKLKIALFLMTFIPRNSESVSRGGA